MSARIITGPIWVVIGIMVLGGCSTSSGATASNVSILKLREASEKERRFKDQLAREELEQKQKSMSLDVARTLINTKRYDLAREFLEEALETGPEPAEAGRIYHLLGVIYQEKSESGPARKMFEEALEHNPDSAASHDRLGILLLFDENIPAATRSFLKATELSPDTARYRNNLGFAYYLNGDLPRAILAYEKAVKLDLSVSRYHNNLGFAYGKSHRYPEAMAQFLLGGTEAMAYENLGFAYWVDGDLDQAQELYQKGMESGPGSAQ